jgi:hypothetical protein
VAFPGVWESFITMVPSDKATPIAGVAATAMPNEKAAVTIANDVYRCTILSDPDN